MTLSPVPRQHCGIRFSKHDGSPHWEYDGVCLGEDEHAWWLFTPPSAPMHKPGRSIAVYAGFVTGVAKDAGWVLAHNAGHPKNVLRYVDITTVPVWEEREGLLVATMVDLDLDVVERDEPHRAGNPYIDDEDEFARHQVRYGYSADLIGFAEATCADLFAAVSANGEPFGEVSARWLTRGLATLR